MVLPRLVCLPKPAALSAPIPRSHPLRCRDPFPRRLRSAAKSPPLPRTVPALLARRPGNTKPKDLWASPARQRRCGNRSQRFRTLPKSSTALPPRTVPWNRLWEWHANRKKQKTQRKQHPCVFFSNSNFPQHSQQKNIFTRSKMGRWFFRECTNPAE